MSTWENRNAARFAAPCADLTCYCKTCCQSVEVVELHGTYWNDHQNKILPNIHKSATRILRNDFNHSHEWSTYSLHLEWFAALNNALTSQGFCGVFFHKLGFPTPSPSGISKVPVIYPS